jgi:hypothetical protein
MKYVPIKDNKDLAREINSRGVVNTNVAAFNMAKARKGRVLSLQQQVDQLTIRLKRLENLLLSDNK